MTASAAKNLKDRANETLAPYVVSTTTKATAAETLDVLNIHNTHQVTIDVFLTATNVLDTPATGTIQVAYKPVGSTAFINFTGTIDLTGGTSITYISTEVYAEQLKFTPGSLEAGHYFLVRYVGRAA